MAIPSLTYQNVIVDSNRPLTGLSGLQARINFPLTCLLAQLKNAHSALLRSNNVALKALQRYQGNQEAKFKEQHKTLQQQCDALIPIMESKEQELAQAILEINQACQQMQQAAMSPIDQAQASADEAQQTALAELRGATDWKTLEPWAKPSY